MALKDKREISIQKRVFKKKFKVEGELGDIFKPLRELIQKETDFHVIQGYRDFKFYGMGNDE